MGDPDELPPIGPEPPGIERGDGPLDPFVPRPYPPRDAGQSPVRGRLALVLARDVARGRAVAAALGAAGCAARHHAGGAGLDDVLRREPFELVLVAGEDAEREDIEALTALPSSPALLCIGPAPRAAALGLDCIDAEAPPAEWIRAVGRALERRVLEDENRRLRDRLAERFAFGNVVTRDSALAAVLRTLEAVADTRATLLFTGETGTGKSLLARAVHAHSGRRDGPFVEVNCGALPSGLLEAELFGHGRGAFTGAMGERPGRFEVADGGTLFLDEIDSAPLELQVKLLRVLQERAFERVGETRTRTSDVRIVAATNASLESRVASGSFREDLYWRLNVVSVRIPPLRDRPRDLAPLALRFVERFAREYGKDIRGVGADGLAYLAAESWPGNVRQLEHVIERAVLLSSGPELSARDLGCAAPADGGAPRGDASALARGRVIEPRLDLGLAHLESATRLPTLREALEEPERRIVTRALELAGGRRDRAARMLDINRSTLFNKMRKYGLLERSFGGSGS